MPTIKHSFYYENLSVADAVRRLKDVLTATEPKAGRMWTVEFTLDAEPANSGYVGPIVYVLKKQTLTDGTADAYVKIVYDQGKIFALMSPMYDASTDNNPTVQLLGAQTNKLEEDTAGGVRVYDSEGELVPNNMALVPTVHLPEGFDPATQVLSKVWIVRRLDPLFDEVAVRKNTDIFAWMTFCVEEAGDSPLTTYGYYSHLGFGVAGEQLVPDEQLQRGVGMYVTAGSFADPENKELFSGVRTFPGGGSTDTNIGTIVCAGDYDTYRSWFYARSAYGQVRAPFDDELLAGARNVGFDFTELVKFSPYSGVRVLTPSYIFGTYDKLYRIVARLPIFYTSLEGLYAGDTIAQDVDGVLKSYILYPMYRYRCVGDVEAKRGLAIFVPADETV